MRLIVAFCVAMLCLTSAVSVQGLQTPGWENVCDPDAPAEAVDAIGRDVISQVCGEFIQCLPTPPFGDQQPCTVPLYLNLLDICTGDDSYCKTYAALMTAAIQQGEDDGDPLAMISRLAIDPVRDSDLLSTYIAFFRSDIQPNFYYFYSEPTLFLAAGAALEFQEQNEAALDVYSQFVSANPLLYFRRGQLYGGLGNTDLAAIDGLSLTMIAEGYPVVAPLAQTLSTQYPFDASPLQDWLVYEDQSYTVGSGGQTLRDLSLRPPSAIQLGIYGDGQALLIMEPDFYGEITTYVYQLIDGNTYTNSSTGRSRVVRLDDTVAIRTQRFEVEGAGGTSREFLAAEGLPDPRPDYDRCENGARWRLRIGSEGRAPENPGNTPLLYDALAGNPLSPTYYFDVVDGPACVEGVAWWQVHDRSTREVSDQIYWIREAFGDAENGFTYEVEVSGNSAVECPGALQANIYTSGSRFVAPEVESADVVVDPISTSDILATIPSRDAFDVLDGPVCVEGNLWFRVDYNGVIGWFRADDGERYFATNFLPPEE